MSSGAKLAIVPKNTTKLQKLSKELRTAKNSTKISRTKYAILKIIRRVCLTYQTLCPYTRSITKRLLNKKKTNKRLRSQQSKKKKKLKFRNRFKKRLKKCRKRLQKNLSKNHLLLFLITNQLSRSKNTPSLWQQCTNWERQIFSLLYS